MKIEINKDDAFFKNDAFFRDTDNRVVVCSTELHDWFEFPQDVKQVTLALSQETNGEDSVAVYYYPSVNTCFQYDTYGLTKCGMFESLTVLDRVIDYVVGQMDLPAQGVLNVSVEYAE